MSAAKMAFSVLLTKEENTWVAHCLELDIVATSSTHEEAVKELRDLIMMQLDYSMANDNMDNFFKPAPREVWERFFRCQERKEEVFDFKPVFTKKQPRPGTIVTSTCSPQEICYA